MTSLFISYRRADSPDIVARIYDKLSTKLHKWELFYDHTSIDVGAEFPAVLRKKVSAADVVLVMIGPKWLYHLRKRYSGRIDYVREEIRLALNSNATVIPILMGATSMPSAEDFADFPDLLPILDIQAQPIDSEPQFTSGCEKLIQFLEKSFPPDFVGSTILGKYRVLRPIGEGGMGEVFAAEQIQPVSRQVALKVIKLGMDTKEVVARFGAESQALAIMDHPNICKLFDAGITPSGRPFFAMEFVKGKSITQYCDDHKLTPNARVELLITVCKGVEHAHEKAILHRDIKPSNILVEEIDGKPNPRVIDFGLAKAMGLRLITKSFDGTDFGKWVGTLEYSSPEQAEGRHLIDRRSDVYSLGVLLYELLAGSPPFTRAEMRDPGDEEFRRMIREKEPSKPSAKLSSSQNLPAIAAKRQIDPARLTKVIREELDWIVMKALEKEPGRRYPTATAFAEDLQNYLNDKPVSAGRPSAIRSFRKSIRRNAKVIARISLAGAMAVILSAFIYVILNGSLNRARVDTKNDAGERERAKREAYAKSMEDFSESLKIVQASLDDPRREEKIGGLREKLRRAEENISDPLNSIEIDNGKLDIINLVIDDSLRKGLFVDKKIAAIEESIAEGNLLISPESNDGKSHLQKSAESAFYHLKGRYYLEKINHETEESIVAAHKTNAISSFLREKDLRTIESPGNATNILGKAELATCYGHLGDCYLVGPNKDKNEAKKWYEMAMAIRSALAELPEKQLSGSGYTHEELVCLHARDFGNLSRCHHEDFIFLKDADKYESINNKKKRVEMLKPLKSSDGGFLPLRYLTERADTAVDLVESFYIYSPELFAKYSGEFITLSQTDYKDIETKYGSFVGVQSTEFKRNIAKACLLHGILLLRQNKDSDSIDVLSKACVKLKEISINKNRDSKPTDYFFRGVGEIFRSSLEASMKKKSPSFDDANRSLSHWREAGDVRDADFKHYLKSYHLNTTGFPID